MKRFLISDLSEVACAMYDNIVDGNLDDVMFVGYYEDTVMVLKHLFMFDDTIPCRINILDDDKYKKEYYITLDSDMNVWCEQAYDYEGSYYLDSITERLYIADDCNSALLKHVICNKNEIYEVLYDLDDECDCDGNCECCCTDKEKDSHEVIIRVATDEDGKLRGFEKSWETFEDGLHYHSTYSFFSSNENMLKNMLDNFDIKY